MRHGGRDDGSKGFAGSALALYAKNGLSLLLRGRWREFVFHLRTFLVGTDLTNVSLEELNLPGERSHEYANSGGRDLEKVLDALEITSADAVIDFGSGKGGALITFSKFPFREITGVELSPDLAAVAQRNLKGLDSRRIRTVVCDAADFTDLDRYTYFYFFNPFPAAVMSAVMRNITASLARSPRKSVVIYFNPEFHDAVIAGSPFVKVREFHHHELKYYIYDNVSKDRRSGDSLT